MKIKYETKSGKKIVKEKYMSSEEIKLREHTDPIISVTVNGRTVKAV